MTEGQHQEDIARWGSQTQGLNPERKQAVPVGQLALDERSGDLISELTQDERKIAYEPTQDSEVLADTVQNDGSGFWNPNLYICVPKSIYVSQNPERSYWECEWRFPSTGTVVLITLVGESAMPPEVDIC